MTRFFFNFRQGESYALDEVGCEFDGVEEAYLGAVGAAQEMWRDLLVRREDPLLCSFEVIDKEGNELFSLPFTEVLDACRGRSRSTPLPDLSNAITEAIACRRHAMRAISEVSSVLEDARKTLCETISLMREVERVVK